METLTQTQPKVKNSRGRMKRKDMFFVPLDKLKLQDDFNQRLDYGNIAELAEQIRNSDEGVKTPLRGFKKDGMFVITDGHRRFKAVQYLKNKYGIEIEVPFLKEKKGYTDTERFFDQILLNEGKEFSQIEKGRVVKKLQDYGLELGEISARLGVSATAISNWLKLTEIQNKELASKIANGTVPAKVAIGKISKAKDKSQAETKLLAEVKRLEQATLNKLQSQPKNKKTKATKPTTTNQKSDSKPKVDTKPIPTEDKVKKAVRKELGTADKGKVVSLGKTYKLAEKAEGATREVVETIIQFQRGEYNEAEVLEILNDLVG